jgi:2-amino-4-hydroxy-6-hydroxymethyldihydropteridine diphosphokinase
MARAFVGLGSNLGDRSTMLEAAVADLERLPGTRVRAVSSFRDTTPVGLTDQPRFLNAVAELETDLTARALLDELLDIERAYGRDRAGVPPGGPRTIDLDLLLYGSERIDEPGLEVPHPRLHERAFALEPLSEVAPGLEVPGHGAVEAVLAELRCSP